MSTELVVLVPSRSRPQNVDRLLKAWTFYHATSDLMIYVDEDDPEVDEYRKLPDHPSEPDDRAASRINGTLNWLASQV